MRVDTEGFTEMALGMDVQQQQPQMPNKHGLYVEFYMEAVQDKAASLEAGHPKFKETPYVMIMVPGDKGSVIRRPIRTRQHPKHDNNRFHNEYVAFLADEKAPIEGLPIEEWPQVTKSQVMELKHFGIKTVEHLAGLTDTNAQKFMGVFDLRNKARTYIEASQSDAPFQKLHAEIDHRNDQITDLMATVNAMKDELAELKGGKKKK